MQVDNFETCVEMVRHGLGYTIIPRIFSGSDSSLQRVDVVYKDGAPMLVNTWMLYRDDYLQLKIVAKFVEHVSQHTGHVKALGTKVTSEINSGVPKLY